MIISQDGNRASNAVMSMIELLLHIEDDREVKMQVYFDSHIVLIIKAFEFSNFLSFGTYCQVSLEFI